MRVYVEDSDGIVLDYSDDAQANVVAPLDVRERTLAFQALTNALALLAGVKLQSSSRAKGAATDGPIAASEQCRRGRKSGVVVRLAERLGAEDA